MSMERVPEAVVAPAQRSSRGGLLIWLVPLAALAASVGFTWFSLGGRGPVIVVHADQGHGIREGAALRYLGINVGTVRDVELGAGGGADGVRLSIQMAEDAAGLARAGTRFWIVRPQLRLDSIEGLETVIGAHYIALDPGPSGSERRTQFTALVDPPLEDEITIERGLEIVLEGKTRFGLQPGAQLTYRGVRIGTVIGVGLASDATSVESRVLVRPAYTQLVREGTRFWETGGIELGLSLTGGLNMDLDSLRTALIGGIAMATPTEPGAPVATGSRFKLHADPEEEWSDWRPALPVGSDLLPPGVALPRLLRASLSWEEGRILRSNKKRVGWMFATPRGVVGPRNLLTLPEDSREGTARLELAGMELDLEALADEVALPETGGLASLIAAPFGGAWQGLLEANEGLASSERRVLTAGEDLIVVRGAARDPLGISGARLLFDERGVSVDRQISLTADWHGALAFARADGAWVGVVLVQKDRTSIVPTPD